MVLLVLGEILYPNPPGPGARDEDKREAGLTTPSITSIDKVWKE